MSPLLPQVKAKDLIRVAKQLGFELDRQKGSHAVFYRPSDKARVVIPSMQAAILSQELCMALSTICGSHLKNSKSFCSAA